MFVFFSFSKIGLGDVMDRRPAFPDYKNVDFTWLLNWFLPKGLVHDFCQEFEMFFVVSLSAK